MQVKAAPGLNVPREDKHSDFISDAAPVDVPDTAYYQRRISDGDLILVPAAPAKSTKGA